MSELEPARECVKVERDSRSLSILVQRITRNGPAEPVGKWVRVRRLPLPASDAEVEAAIEAALQMPKYFATCKECGQRKPRGWMHDRQTCQGCAERHHGIVY